MKGWCPSTVFSLRHENNPESWRLKLYFLHQGKVRTWCSPTAMRSAALICWRASTHRWYLRWRTQWRWMWTCPPTRCSGAIYITARFTGNPEPSVALTFKSQCFPNSVFLVRSGGGFASVIHLVWFNLSHLLAARRDRGLWATGRVCRLHLRGCVICLVVIKRWSCSPFSHTLNGSVCIFCMCVRMMGGRQKLVFSAEPYVLFNLTVPIITTIIHPFTHRSALAHTHTYSSHSCICDEFHRQFPSSLPNLYPSNLTL